MRRLTWPILVGAFTSPSGCLAMRKSAKRPGPQQRIWAAKISRFGCLPNHRAFSLIGTRISNMMNGKLRAMTAPLSRIIWDRTQIATTIQTPPSNRVFRASSNITLLQKMSWQKAMRANTDRRKKPLMRSPQLGKRSPIKSGAIARLSCIKRRLVYNIIVLGRAGIPALPA